MSFRVEQENDGRWVAQVDYAHRHAAKDVGFTWDLIRRHWFTYQDQIALRARKPFRAAVREADREAAGSREASAGMEGGERAAAREISGQRRPVEGAVTHTSPPGCETMLAQRSTPLLCFELGQPGSVYSSCTSRTISFCSRIRVVFRKTNVYARIF